MNDKGANMKPSICRMVTYRSKTGNYDVPAVINCTVDTIDPKGVELGHVPALSSPTHVHLTVFTPGKPATRRPESDPDLGPSSGGTYQEWDIPQNDEMGEDIGAPKPGSWRWPERV